MHLRWQVAVLLLPLPALPASQQQSHHQAPDSPQVLAPGYSALQFPAPALGSYSLPTLGKASDGKLLDSAGKKTTLHALYDDKTVVLSFIYTS